MNSPKVVSDPVALVPGVTHLDYAGYACLKLRNVHGTALVSLHGGQLLSWVPAGQRDVFWLSPQAKPAPAAIRGGVPVCWPWFGKQGLPQGAMQHGPVRNVTWNVVASEVTVNGGLLLSLELDRTAPGGDAVDTYAKHLEVRLDIALGPELRMSLQTHNRGTAPFALTQALHTYFAVGEVEQVQLQGVEGLRYDSRVDGTRGNLQVGAFKLQNLCDNTYAQASQQSEHHYQLIDPSWQRQISLTTQGSQSTVVWNPGAEGAAAMADVPDAAWKDFLCVEAANAGADVVVLAPGAQHHLQQTLSCQAWPTA
ncbi:MAG: D-hexose-6-phosphate mutarotase [Burkholderiales bacterium PBB3]|nr:MAG: D-hexose-6-phosphate mutarotase [Burkholderiales bacterium PBB3]